MNRNQLLPLLVAIASLSLPIALTTSSPVRAGGHSHSGGHSEGHSEGHAHGVLDIPAGQPVPEIKLTAYPDAVRGWNLNIQVKNFKFAPHHASQVHIPGEGHAHLLVNGKKVTRIYGDWYYIKELPPGSNQVTVALSTNNHQDLRSEGKLLMDTITIQPTFRTTKCSIENETKCREYFPGKKLENQEKSSENRGNFMAQSPVSV
ncbi:hypothetical protein [Roseofilum casamattae]|uniref:DUF4399 domain-containing protein n=1 Tax=Roseofilum casamattae BLCC-M143 TaxID=3022442 RepID=A0ABT7C1R1_9CYAN|nr:hypothetical protein [Roseofilum casamattae]MDJ1185384.1 hypothetical protein [Roseofilum casamattae BLCC-M143]